VVHRTRRGRRAGKLVGFPVSRWTSNFANGLGDVRAPQTKKPAMGAYKHASSSQMWDDDAATDAYNDNLLSQLREEDDAVDEYNDDLLSQLWEEDDR